MKKYTKPSMTIAKFGSKEEIANGSVYQIVDVQNNDTYGPISVYEIASLGANS